MLRVNPATVVKVYQRLTGDGVLVVRRGEGTFVAGRRGGGGASVVFPDCCGPVMPKVG